MVCDYDIMDSLSVATKKESESVGFGDECFYRTDPERCFSLFFGKAREVASANG